MRHSHVAGVGMGVVAIVGSGAKMRTIDGVGRLLSELMALCETFLGAALVKVTAEYSAHRTVRLNHPHDGHDGSTTRLPYYQLNTRHIIIKDDFDNHRDNIKQLMASTAKPISLLIADNNYKLNWGPWDVAWTSEFKNTLNLVDHCNDGLQNCKFISFLTDQALPHAMAAISERDMQFKLFYY
eukprot:jgi/Tetstr1/427875/TSEL_017951.t1